METKKIKSISNLMIEVTRKCNLACDHCLRGEAQSKDFDPLTIIPLFKEVNEIITIAFTGGEPLLAIPIIHEIMKLADEYGVTILNFYMATNGTVNNIEAAKLLIELYAQCDDNDVSSVRISNDEYHRYDRQCSGLDSDCKLLLLLPFVNMEQDGIHYSKDDSVIAQGRALHNFDADNSRALRDSDFNIDVYCTDEGRYIFDDGIFYINVNADVVFCCDLSYESQELYIMASLKDPLWIEQAVKNLDVIMEEDDEEII